MQTLSQGHLASSVDRISGGAEMLGLHACQLVTHSSQETVP